MVTQPPQMPAIPSVSAPTSDSIGIVFYSSLGLLVEILPFCESFMKLAFWAVLKHMVIHLLDHNHGGFMS